MIQVFDKHMKFVREISYWDPALCPNEGYAVGTRGVWFHKALDRLKQVQPWDLTPEQKAYNLLLGK